MPGTRSGKRGPGLWVGAALVLTGGGIVASTAGMAIAPTYARVGPQIFPYVAGIAVALMGLYFIVTTLLHHDDRIIADTDATDWRALAMISAGFVIVILAIKPVGFIITAALLFFLVAQAYGSERRLRDGLIAIALSVTAYLVFTRLLNLQLPVGVLKGLL